MKTIYLILAIALVSCFSAKNSIQNDNVYYFYFQDNDSTMNSFYNPEKQIKSYWYELQKADNIVFEVQKEEDKLKIKTIEARDTIGLNIKNYNWLNPIRRICNPYTNDNRKPRILLHYKLA